MREKNRSHRALSLDQVDGTMSAKTVGSGGDDLTVEIGRAGYLYRVRCGPLDYWGMINSGKAIRGL